MAEDMKFPNGIENSLTEHNDNVTAMLFNAFFDKYGYLEKYTIDEHVSQYDISVHEKALRKQYRSERENETEVLDSDKESIRKRWKSKLEVLGMDCDTLRNELKEKKLSQRDLALMVIADRVDLENQPIADLSKYTLMNRWIKGWEDFDGRYIKLIAKALNTTTDKVLGFKTA